jgi:site-specific recombinase XerD
MQKLTKRAVEALDTRDRPYDVRDSELRGFLVRVETGGTKSFFLDYRLRGKRNRYRLGTYPNLSADGARALAQAIAGDVARGTDPQARRKAEREQATRERLSTLRAFLDGRYEPWARTHLKSAAFQLARIRSDFLEQLDQPLHAFNRFVVEGIRQRWKKGGMAARSINRDIQRLQSVLSRAVEWGVLDHHPLRGLKPMKVDKTGRVRFLTTQEETALRKALAEREEKLKQARIRFNTWRIARGRRPLPEREGELLDHLRPLVLVALNTGLRRGELLGLKWGAVNFSAKLLTVVAENAKSGHTRRVPLNTEALSVLTAWYGRQGRPNSDALVFPGSTGERMTRIDTSWRSLMKVAGLKNFRLHDCRHHFASRLVQAGVDLYTVKELLGHSEIAMTERYSHLAPDNLRTAVEKVAG